MAVSSLPPITQEFRADVSSWRKAAEIIARHMTAMARDLAVLEADQSGGLTSCGPSCEGGMCGCEEDDDDDRPRTC